MRRHLSKRDSDRAAGRRDARGLVTTEWSVQCLLATTPVDPDELASPSTREAPHDVDEVAIARERKFARQAGLREHTVQDRRWLSSHSQLLKVEGGSPEAAFATKHEMTGLSVTGVSHSLEHGVPLASFA